VYDRLSLFPFAPSLARTFTVTSDTPLVIVITGPVGAGKTTTASALYDQLADARVPVAMIDVDHVRWAWPEASPFNMRLGYDNIAAVAVNYLNIGVRTFVLADVVETPEQRVEYERAVPGAEVKIVRLNVPLATVEERLRGRESEESIAWYLRRAPELQEIFETRGVGDVVVDIGNHTPEEVAAEIFNRLELDDRERLEGDAE
jgi:adenylylsulfate kinase